MGYNINRNESNSCLYSSNKQLETKLEIKYYLLQQRKITNVQNLPHLERRYKSTDSRIWGNTKHYEPKERHTRIWNQTSINWRQKKKSWTQQDQHDNLCIGGNHSNNKQLLIRNQKEVQGGSGIQNQNLPAQNSLLSKYMIHTGNGSWTSSCRKTKGITHRATQKGGIKDIL